MAKPDDLLAVYAALRQAAPDLPLAQSASDIVPGEGSPEAEIVFIGEAPGEEEARLKRPFVGRSGQLFRRTLEAQDFKPEDTYITNIVKVRPPSNRDPLPEEIAAYKPYLDQEIQILEPLLIVTLGRYSMAKFLPDVKISQVHGRLHKVIWNGRTQFVLPMYHPAAALRATNVKEAFEADFKKIKKVIALIQEQKLTEQVKENVVEAIF